MATLAQALAVEVEGDVAHLAVRDGHDVYGIPHGGYLLALLGQAVLAVSGQPDLFTITAHYLRKAAVGPLTVEVTPVGGSRRFTSLHAVARQDGEVVITALASVGDREPMTGPTWTDVPAWSPAEDALSPPAGGPGLPFTPPAIAERFGQRLELATTGFAVGRRTEHAVLRSVVTPDPVDQLAALVACDVTPPAVWNVLGNEGWVPTLELTAHVRARPVAGPMTVEVATHHVSDGFFEEDALVRDAAGRVVVQSRQLARWTGA
jgi:hypothetical protein